MNRPIDYSVALEATDAWIGLLGRVTQKGIMSSPRGMAIKELLGSQVQVNMQRPVVLVKERKLSYKFMAGEAWWILSGKNDVPSISRYCKRIADFSDDGEIFFGAYGPKISEQRNYVIRKLEEDPDSRQAVISIWRENPPETRDVPCTISVQWLIRDGFLHCIDTMRSNDVWLGFPYDVFNFSMLSWMILDELKWRNGDRFKDLQLGTLFLNAGSHHIYARDLVKAEELLGSVIMRHPFESVAGNKLDGIIVAGQLESVLNCNSTEHLDPFFSEFKNNLIK